MLLFLVFDFSLNHTVLQKRPLEITWSQIIVFIQANSRAIQLWKQLWQTISERGKHICLIRQHIITEPITKSELRERWQRGQSTVSVCVWAEGEDQERMTVYSQICSPGLCCRLLKPPGNRSHSGQPETHDVILREQRLPAVSEKGHKTQSQHHTITGVNCIYSCTAVVD